ncbi:MAG: serine/threonine protein kinase [Myxococcales bacterium]|nr:serine/threonine protein kinase [Myxococcales bacterium]
MSEDPKPRRMVTQTYTEGVTFDGYYKIEQRIGAGAMATVYEARRLADDKKVALKVFRATVSEDKEALSRFQREVQAMSALDHPNIVSVFGFRQTSDGVAYIVLELVRGRTLQRVVEQGPLKPIRAVSIAGQIAGALEAAHRLQLVHRDLKPENIMLCRSDEGKLIAKILDFGLVKNKQTADWQTGPGLVVGSAMYMSPEQINGDAVDARTDIYALGLLIYEMIVGFPPFRDQNPYDLMAKQVREIPKRLRDISPRPVPDALDSLVADCLEKDPDLRPENTRILRERLSKVVRELRDDD